MPCLRGFANHFRGWIAGRGLADARGRCNHATEQKKNFPTPYRLGHGTADERFARASLRAQAARQPRLFQDRVRSGAGQAAPRRLDGGAAARVHRSARRHGLRRPLRPRAGPYAAKRGQASQASRRRELPQSLGRGAGERPFPPAQCRDGTRRLGRVDPNHVPRTPDWRSNALRQQPRDRGAECLAAGRARKKSGGCVAPCAGGARRGPGTGCAVPRNKGFSRRFRCNFINFGRRPSGPVPRR